MEKYPYRSDIGAVLQGLLNGLKHTPETISRVINIDQHEIEKVIVGKAPMTETLEKALLSVTGINQRDFYPPELSNKFRVQDDTRYGLRMMCADDTKASKRTLTRGPGVPYYIYADTAMSNTSTFRPEWIKELFVHDGESADDLPDWAFNKGHFEHQVTYFIGPVNFYWIDKDGKRHVRKMNTGDTNYISPFVPHTFTTREKDQGLILAVTYGGAIATPEFRAEIGKYSIEEFMQWAQRKTERLILPHDKNMKHGVVFRGYDEAESDESGIKVLVQTPYQPKTGVYEMSIAAAPSNTLQSVLTDRWMYNVGSANVVLKLGAGRSIRIEQGDSVFVKPGRKHSLTAEQKNTKLLIVDIMPGSGDAYLELKAIQTFAGDRGLARVHTETMQWY